MLSLSFVALCCALVSPPPPPPPARVSSDQAVAEALANNRELAASRARVPIADAARLTAGLRPNPDLSLSADHLDLAGTPFTDANGGGPSEYAVHADYLWEQGGKRRHRLAVADGDRAVTRLEVDDEVRRLVLEVRNAHVDLLLAQRELALASDNLTSLRRVAELSAIRVKSGDLAEVELMRTRVAVVQLENDVARRDLSRRIAQRRLALLLGRPVSAPPPEATGEFAAPPAALPSIEDLERLALASRPDLLALGSGRDRAQANIGLQQALGRVDFTVGTEFRRQQGLAGKANTLGFFLSTPLPFFNRNQGEVAKARAELTEATRRTEAAREAAASEVREAYDQFLTARGLLDRVGQGMRRDATEVRTALEYAYERGEATLVELLDAQRAFNDTMESQLTAQADLARSLNLLDAVVGKGINR